MKIHMKDYWYASLFNVIVVYIGSQCQLPNINKQSVLWLFCKSILRHFILSQPLTKATNHPLNGRPIYHSNLFFKPTTWTRKYHGKLWEQLEKSLWVDRPTMSGAICSLSSTIATQYWCSRSTICNHRVIVTHHICDLQSLWLTLRNKQQNGIIITTAQWFREIFI